jgi:hypothetical protein
MTLIIDVFLFLSTPELFSKGLGSPSPVFFISLCYNNTLLFFLPQNNFREGNTS